MLSIGYKYIETNLSLSSSNASETFPLIKRESITGPVERVYEKVGNVYDSLLSSILLPHLKVYVV